MRTTILSFAALVVVAACADDRQPTSPNRGPAATNRNNVQVSTPSAAGGAKPVPVDSVGFTKTFEVASTSMQVTRAAQDGVIAYAYCPAGSVVVGGGYEAEVDPGFSGVTDLRITLSRPGYINGASRWEVTGRLVGNTDNAAVFQAFAVCAK